MKAGNRKRRARGNRDALTSADNRWQGRVERLLALAFGTTLVWAWLVPADAVGVFQGGALGQNLVWLIMAAGAAWWGCASGAPCTVRRWHLAVGILTCGWLALGATLAGLENNPRTGWIGFWHVIALAGWYWAATAVLRRCGANGVATLMLIIVAGGAGLGAYGLYQIRVSVPAMQKMFEENPDEMLAEANIYAPEGSPQRARFRARLYSPEPYATFALANSLAVVLSVPLLLLIGVGWSFLSAGLADGHGGRACLGWLLAIGVTFTCWLLTRSRAAWVAVLAVLAVLAVSGVASWRRARSGGNADLRKRQLAGLGGLQWVMIALAGLVGLGAAAWVLNNDQLILREAPKSLAFRLEYWIATARMIADYGWRGVGLGNFQNYYPFYKLETASEEIADPHNWVLDLMVNLSVLVAAVVIGWLTARLRGLASSGRWPVAFSHREKARPAPETDLIPWLVGGAVGGGLICLGGVVAFQGTDLEAQLAGWTCGLAVGWLLWPNRQRFAQSRWIVGAVAAMLIALLSSGSWQAPGIALVLLALLAGRNGLIPPNCVSGASSGGAVEETGEPSHAAGEASRLSAVGDMACAGSWDWGQTPLRRGQVALFAWWMSMLVLFVVQCWMPVSRSRRWLQQATWTENLDERGRLLELARRADPLNAEPVQQLADLAVQRAVLAGDSRFQGLANRAVERLDEWCRWEETRYGTWRSAGDNALRLAARAERIGEQVRPWLEKALAYYRRAVERYPTSVELRAQLAVVAGQMGRWEEFERELAEARRLSERTPHGDRKLSSQLVWWPLSLDPALGIPMRTNHYYPAEPMLDALRKMHMKR